MSQAKQNPITKYFSEFGVLKDCGKNFWYTNIIQFLEGLGYFSMIHILTLYLIRYCGFSDADSAFWVSMYTLFISMFVLAVGSICDIIGLKRTYTIGFAILIGGRLLLGFGSDIGTTFNMAQTNYSYITMAGIVLMSFGTAFMSPCIQTSIRRFTTLRSRATGFNFYYLFMNIGAIVASVVIVHWLLGSYGETEGTYLIVNVGTAFYAIAYIFTRLINENFYAVPEERMKPEQVERRRPLKLIAEVMREKPFQRLVIFLILTLGVRLVFTIQFLVMPQYYTRTVGDDFDLGMMNGINPIIIVIGLITIIPVLNRFSTVNLMIYGMSISACSLIFMAIPPQWYFVIPGIDTLPQAYFVAILLQIVVFAIGEVLFSPRFSEYIARVAPKDKVATYMSLAALPMFIAKPVNGVIGGLLVSYFCYEGIAAKMDTGHIGYWESPEIMWFIYLMMAIISPIAIIMTKRMFVSADKDHALTPDHDESNKDEDKKSDEPSTQNA